MNPIHSFWRRGVPKTKIKTDGTAHIDSRSFSFEPFPSVSTVIRSIRATVACVPPSSLPNLVALSGGSLEAKLPTIWTDTEKRKTQKKEDQSGRKPSLAYRFPIFETSATAVCDPTGTYYSWHSVPIQVEAKLFGNPLYSLVLFRQQFVRKCSI